ncbi:MAG TPA: bifunctional phosphoribosylaminoimidazolecarboxamide formyltransferase/IMP cyclohydrolase [Candidatus Acidoferrales bacterium]|nr:bifunctional phosphoribosylaminoimidazolecarboxamide formyltransferase/IMP cyclohydrolase [Candidatus Acidoferrales bacterium]
MKIRRALISVTDKTGLIDFASTLTKSGAEIFSTGGTLRVLQEAGVPAKSITEITKFPEILDGRVKTLHPAIFAGILARKNVPEHIDEIKKLSLSLFDLVVVNLYRFEETVASGANLETVVENIDIGGPSLIRAAAKNYESVAVVVDPSQYGEVASAIDSKGEVGFELMRELAAKAFEKVAGYDVAIADFFGGKFLGDSPPGKSIFVAEAKTMEMRYGENPHQTAGFYGNLEEYFQKLHGKELSYNNLVDVDAAQRLIQEFDQPAAVIIKHTNPCGVAMGNDIHEAYTKALQTDPKSAFGGIVAVNGRVGVELAELLNQIFLEVLIAPEFSSDALDLLKKKKDRRLIQNRKRLPNDIQIRSSCGGFLGQTADDVVLNENDLKVVTSRAPTEHELTDLKFAYKVCKHVKSNAIVFVKDGMTLGTGAGQMSRVDSVKIARMKADEAGLDLKGSCVASDAYFPFSDNVEEVSKAGATAIIQPGGSVRDSESIEAANRLNISMVFTGIRHFKH